MSRLSFCGCAVGCAALFEDGIVDIPDVCPLEQFALFPRFCILAAVRSRSSGLFGQKVIRRLPKFRLGFGQLAVERRQPCILFGGSRLDTPKPVELRTRSSLSRFLYCDEIVRCAVVMLEV